MLKWDLGTMCNLQLSGMSFLGSCKLAGMMVCQLYIQTVIVKMVLEFYFFPLNSFTSFLYFDFFLLC